MVPAMMRIAQPGDTVSLRLNPDGPSSAPVPVVGKAYEFASTTGNRIDATVVREETYMGDGYANVRNPKPTGDRWLPVMSPGTTLHGLRVTNDEGTYLLDKTRFAIVRELPETKEAS